MTTTTEQEKKPTKEGDGLSDRRRDSRELTSETLRVHSFLFFMYFIF